MELSNMKHTPGPWWTDGKYSVDECGIAIIAARTDCGPLPGNPTRGMVAWASEILPENADRCETNARLIAAAPELLEAAERALNFIANTEGELGVTLDSGDILRAAIAKARGDMEHD